MALPSVSDEARRRLSLEGLESREMMAGNVAAWVSQGTLFITGDNASNRVSVAEIAPGKVSAGSVCHSDRSGVWSAWAVASHANRFDQFGA